MKTPRYTDEHRFAVPYADAKASMEPGYLAEKFRAMADQKEKIEAEKKAKDKREADLEAANAAEAQSKTRTLTRKAA